MRLKAPYSGVTVHAEGELAQRLMARGFSPAEKPKEEGPKPRARKSRKKE